ncbi:MAG: adenosylcobinamide-phosphate synthase [Zhongshania sp.]|jgi:adenosylcobinamide-phosphate synthase
MTITVFWVCLIALILDRCLGEVKRWHPLVGFGYLASRSELLANRFSQPWLAKCAGSIAWLLLILPVMTLVALLDWILAGWSVLSSLALHVLVLYWAIGWQSMREHILPLYQDLRVGNLVLAARRVGGLVSRDTGQLNSQEITAASLETTIENSNDALFASLFWYVLGGPVAVVLHRLANTLDAMWGYRNVRFQYFGWFAARNDDVLNFIPAQLTSLGFVLASMSMTSFRCWFTQGWRWKSINAGSVMASGAAALDLQLGGEASYHSESQLRPMLGYGAKPKVGDLLRALALVQRQLFLWLMVLAILAYWR